MNEWFTIIRVGVIVLLEKILEKMKWAEEVEKGDEGLGLVQGHIRGHDLGQGQGTFKKCYDIENSIKINSEHPDVTVQEGTDTDRKMKILDRIRTL